MRKINLDKKWNFEQKISLFIKEEMTAIYLFKKFDFCKGIPLGKSNFLKW
eukprot:UN22161